MSTTKEFVLTVPSAGVDQSGQSFIRPKGSFWKLVNFRPWLNQLTQTPLFRNYFILDVATAPHGLIEIIFPVIQDPNTATFYIVLDRVRPQLVTEPGLMQQTMTCIFQSKVPNNTTVTGQLLISNLDIATFNTTTTFDVQIASATTFKYSVNGGAFSSPITIAPVVVSSPPGMNPVTFRFQATTGFTPGDLWQWKKQQTGPTFSASVIAPQMQSSGGDYYVAGFGRNVLRYRGAWGTLTSVGYQRVYGDYCAIFYNHLVIGRYAAGVSSGGDVVDGIDPKLTPYRLAWSDLNDPDNFFATDINEADAKDIQSSAHNDDPLAFGITGLETLRSQCFIFTADNIHSMTYVGLPNVMQIDPMNFGVGSIFVNGVVKTTNGIIFIAHDNIYLFDGNSVTAVGHKIRDMFFSTLPPKADVHRQMLRGYFDRDKNEVCWNYKTYIGPDLTNDWQGMQLVYQVTTGDFYFRNLPDFSTLRTITAQCPVIGQYQKMLYGCVDVYIDSTLSEAGNNTANLQKDYTPSGSFGVSQQFTSPSAETQDYVGDVLAYQKEIESLYIDGGFESGDGIQVSYAARDYVSTATYVSLPDKWVTTINRGRLSLPRINFRALRLKFTGISVSCAAGFILRAWGMFVYGNKQETEK